MSERLYISELDHQELFGKVYDSQYGADLVSRTRFNDFKPDWVGTELWCDMLGDDVNNLYHMSHTYDIARDFCEREKLSEQSTDLILTTAITHDIGEAIIGDIALPSKTQEDERLEQIAYGQIARELFGEDEGAYLTERVWSVLNKTDPEHGDMFRAVEYIGYCTTALRAGKMAAYLAHNVVTIGGTRAQKEQLMGGLLGLNKAVETHNFKVLADYAKKYPSIPGLLKEPMI